MSEPSDDSSEHKQNSYTLSVTHSTLDLCLRGIGGKKLIDWSPKENIININFLIVGERRSTQSYVLTSTLKTRNLWQFWIFTKGKRKCYICSTLLRNPGRKIKKKCVHVCLSVYLSVQVSHSHFCGHCPQISHTTSFRHREDFRMLSDQRFHS